MLNWLFSWVDRIPWWGTEAVLLAGACFFTYLWKRLWWDRINAEPEEGDEQADATTEEDKPCSTGL